MALTNKRPKRKITGGRYIGFKKKRVANKRSLPTMTKLGEKKQVTLRVRGGQVKTRLYSESMANVFDPKSKKTSKVKILNVTDNAANRHFIRQNILTRGAVIETEKGKAKITSRPGQEGSVNAVLI